MLRDLHSYVELPLLKKVMYQTTLALTIVTINTLLLMIFVGFALSNGQATQWTRVSFMKIRSSFLRSVIDEVQDSSEKR